MNLKEIKSDPVFQFAFILTIAMAIGFQGWRTLLNNFAVGNVKVDGFWIGVIQSAREIPGFLSLLVIFITVILSEFRIASISILLMGSGIALVGSVVLCMVVFIFLQTGFIAALSPQDLKNGWTHLALMNDQSPFVSLLAEHGINWAIPILYFAAIISPLAAALVYCTSAARSLYGIAANGYAPQVLLKLNKRNESALTVWINFILAVIIFQFFKNWDQIASLLTCLFAISYGLAPVCMLALRVKLPSHLRPLKLPWGYAWAYAAFFITTLLIYWVGWGYYFKSCMVLSLLYYCDRNIPENYRKGLSGFQRRLESFNVVMVLSDYHNYRLKIRRLWQRARQINRTIQPYLYSCYLRHSPISFRKVHTRP